MTSLLTVHDFKLFMAPTGFCLFFFNDFLLFAVLLVCLFEILYFKLKSIFFFYIFAISLDAAFLI